MDKLCFGYIWVLKKTFEVFTYCHNSINQKRVSIIDLHKIALRENTEEPWVVVKTDDRNNRSQVILWDLINLTDLLFQENLKGYFYWWISLLFNHKCKRESVVRIIYISMWKRTSTEAAHIFKRPTPFSTTNPHATLLVKRN